MPGLPRPLRGAVLISVALAALALGVAHTVWPKPAPEPAVAAHASSPPPARPIGVLHLAGRSISAPKLTGDEYGFVAALNSLGIDVQRIDPNPWSGLYDQAVVDTVITDRDVYVVFAPALPGRSRWVCRAADAGAIIGGGDAPAYEVGIGGDAAVLQLPPGAAYGTFGEDVVIAPSAQGYERIASLLQPATCPLARQ